MNAHQRAAQFYHRLGANVNAIKQRSKRPINEWTRWQTERQSKDDFDRLPWDKAYGVGVINGIGGWRTLELDAHKDANGTPKDPVSEATLRTVLQALGLPEDYPWTWRSGSGTGWEIAFLCHESMLPGALPAGKNEAGVFWGWPPDGSDFHHIELRWERNQTIYPPSGYVFSKGKRAGHPGPGYQWHNKPPIEAPTAVPVRRIIHAFHTICPPPPHTLSSIDEATKEQIRQRFDMVAYAQQHLGGDVQKESSSEVRITGHGGLLVNTENQVWHCFSGEIGGDCFDLVGYHRFGAIVKNLNGKTPDILQETANYAGVVLPERRYDTLPSSQRQNKDISDETGTRTQVLITANYTDAGNAECMALLYGDTFRYCHTREKWLYWDSNRWKIDTDGKAERAARDVARARQAAAVGIEDLDRKKRAMSWSMSSENMRGRLSMLKAASVEEQFATTVELYDRDILLAAASNGTLDLRTGTHRPANPNDYITMQLGTAYADQATCPRWEQFLHEVFGGDQDLIAYIQRAIGYSLTGDTSEQKLFLCHGGGANGKSVFLEILSALLGEYAANASFDTFDAGRRNEATNDLAALKAKRVVTVIETEEDRRLAEARVKAVTGQDAITCRFLYGEFFTYRPQFKIWLAMNHKPLIRGTDRGIWRRIQLIPFAQSFEGREDHDLTSKLRAELPGILNWAIEGLRAWKTHRLGTAEAVQQATKAYQQESDLVQQWMDECVDLIDTAKTPTADAYRSFRTWCREHGYPDISDTSFGRRMTEKGFQRKSDGKQRLYLGIVVHDPLTRSDTFDTFDTFSEKSLREKSSGESSPQTASKRVNSSNVSVGDVDHDQTRAREVRSSLERGDIPGAKRAAQRIRGNRMREEVDALIAQHEVLA